MNKISRLFDPKRDKRVTLWVPSDDSSDGRLSDFGTIVLWSRLKDEVDRAAWAEIKAANEAGEPVTFSFAGTRITAFVKGGEVHQHPRWQFKRVGVELRLSGEVANLH